MQRDFSAIEQLLSPTLESSLSCQVYTYVDTYHRSPVTGTGIAVTAVPVWISDRIWNPSPGTGCPYCKLVRTMVVSRGRLRSSALFADADRRLRILTTHRYSVAPMSGEHEAPIPGVGQTIMTQNAMRESLREPLNSGNFQPKPRLDRRRNRRPRPLTRAPRRTLWPTPVRRRRRSWPVRRRRSRRPCETPQGRPAPGRTR